MERNKLLKELSEVEFAFHDTALYLDTHPNDREALAALKNYKQRYNELKKAYEDNCGMLSRFSPNNSDKTWTWIANPWPWD